jgi:hypothetical protein
MSNKALLRMISLYLLGIPVITSINGLSMHLMGISAVGPIYHTVFSLALIGAGIASRRVEKSPLAVLSAIAFVTLLIGAQCALGLSDFSIRDIGHLYKWLMPILLLAVYRHWRHLGTIDAQREMERLFRAIPLLYAGLIFVSLVTWLTFGFNPTVFEEGARMRFVGFSWGYNATVNSFFICGFVTLVLLQTPAWIRIVCGVAFLLLLSKTAVVYFALLGYSFARPYLSAARFRSRVVAATLALPLMAAAAWFGLNQTMRSADLYNSRGESDLTTIEFVSTAFTSARLNWWLYVLEDAPNWPTVNLILGNGMNIDRRHETALWWNMLGNRHYPDLKLDKTTKSLELDILGHFDLFGIVGVCLFTAVFFVHPAVSIKAPLFRPYLLVFIALAAFGGHLLNNSHATPVLVYLYLFLRHYNPAAFVPAGTGRGISGLSRGVVTRCPGGMNMPAPQAKAVRLCHLI